MFNNNKIIQRILSVKQTTMKTIFTVVIIILTLALKSQELSLKFFIIDNLGRIDSVLIGKDINATIGIDTNFEEENIFGTPFDSIDIRSIHRTEENHECLSESIWDNSGTPYYFENNMDLKIDVRYLTFDVKNSCFEIEINAYEYPIKLISDVSGWPLGSLHFYWIGLFDNNCNLEKELDLFGPDMDTTMIENDTIIDRIIVKLNHEVGIEESSQNTFMSSFPNPVDNILNVKFNEPFNGLLKITSVDGKVIYSSEVQGQDNLIINTSLINSGVYLIQLENNEYIFQQKIIKQ